MLHHKVMETEKFLQTRHWNMSTLASSYKAGNFVYPSPRQSSYISHDPGAEVVLLGTRKENQQTEELVYQYISSMLNDT